jgi:hypothetical protein
MNGYKIIYSPAGTVTSGRTDYIVIWSNNLKNAIEEFEKTEINLVTYNQHAIVNIEVLAK